MISASQSARGDLLTRTTLRLAGGSQPSAIDKVIQALQRVPGVLTVEADATGANALVAHDAAVPLPSLVAAAGFAGATASVVGEVRGPTPSVATAPLLGSMVPAQHLRAVAVAAILAVFIVDIAFPYSPEKRWLVLVPLAVMWMFVMYKALVGRRQ
jgi:hypothetical protein